MSGRRNETTRQVVANGLAMGRTALGDGHWSTAASSGAQNRP
jgi:hypothetical protein